ncbi:LemA family protein, partial [Mesorhizobium sp. M1A.T.Ca.IN.004.03.1.1]
MYIALGVIVLVALYLVFVYNGLVRARQMAEEAWSGIDVQLKRRADLIPNLIETVKGYAA